MCIFKRDCQNGAATKRQQRVIEWHLHRIQIERLSHLQTKKRIRHQNNVINTIIRKIPIPKSFSNLGTMDLAPKNTEKRFEKHVSLPFLLHSNWMFQLEDSLTCLLGKWCFSTLFEVDVSGSLASRPSERPRHTQTRSHG